MRFIIAPEFFDQMKEQDYHLPDCYVRPGEYLHHMYIEGVKYIIGPAVLDMATSQSSYNAPEYLMGLVCAVAYLVLALTPHAGSVTAPAAGSATALPPEQDSGACWRSIGDGCLDIPCYAM